MHTSATKKNRTADFFQDNDADGDADFEENIGNDGTSSLSTSGGGGETNRVLGGHKAALKSESFERKFRNILSLLMLQDPNVSDEAKNHSEQVLKDNDAI